MSSLTRRCLALGGVAGATGALTGCADLPGIPVLGRLLENWPRDGGGPVRSPDYAKVYGPIRSERPPVPAFDYTVMDPSALRSDVAYRGPETEGTVVVEPRRHVLYLVESGGRATRYGVAIGPGGRAWHGTAEIVAIGASRGQGSIPGQPASAAWSDLRISGRRRVVPDPAGRLLGARSVALASRGRDTGYRIHGTPWPETVGSDVTVGCVAMIDQDVIHLAGRLVDGGTVVVLA